mgnify:CR=1 FL=1
MSTIVRLLEQVLQGKNLRRFLLQPSREALRYPLYVFCSAFWSDGLIMVSYPCSIILVLQHDNHYYYLCPGKYAEGDHRSRIELCKNGRKDG